MSGYDITGVVLGALGMAAVVQLMWQFIQSKLPSEQLKILDDTLSVTDSIFHSKIEEESFQDVEVIRGFEEELLAIRDDTETLRAKVYRATTLRKQCGGMLTGLSSELARVCSQVIDVRARISDAGDLGRKQNELVDRRSRNLHPPYASASPRHSNMTAFKAYQPFSSFNLPADQALPALSRPAPSYVPRLSGIGGSVLRQRDTASISSMQSVETLVDVSLPNDSMDAPTDAVEVLAKPANSTHAVAAGQPLASAPVLDPTPAALPRADLEAVCAAINQLKGTVHDLADVIEAQRSGATVDPDAVCQVTERAQHMSNLYKRISPMDEATEDQLLSLPSPPSDPPTQDIPATTEEEASKVASPRLLA